MVEKLKNVVEDIARDFLDNSLALRYDICTCATCKTDMLAYILSRVPAKYATTEQGAMHTVIEQAKVEHRAEIARAVIAAIDIISKNPRHKQHEDRKKTFELLLDKIFEDRGLDFRHYREEILKRRVAMRMRVHSVSSYADYLRFLIKNPNEYEELFAALCINVTEFFRDPEVWVTLRYLFEKLAKEKIKKSDLTIKIWSGGCSSGEEPYSIAIMLKEMAKAGLLNNFSIEITGTDIDKVALKMAEATKYPKESLKNVNAQYLKSYFTPLPDGRHQLNKEIKDMVKFQYLDLINQDGLGERDVVICRNVFIYFSRSLQEQLLTKFHKALKPGGYLIMGKAEIIFSEAKEIFKDIDINARIYQKKEM
jgi:chemotaxis protein methyltransferase CheR